ncbi:ArnT family glycosyltransferase [Desulfatiglans anilini]|uniref:ArnT family glycosyltransferase n=1 Tax=Desulfatiglans anilini TaxID=90728 RepID=UPI001376CC20|nr:glycosyltransferase family 39 protein [Desulfatiglans anilini]
MFMWDEAEYASISRSVLNGEGFSICGQPNPLRPPVLPLAGAAAALLAGNPADHILKVAILLFALGALFIVYLVTSAASNRMTALAAAAFLGMMPAFWQHTSYFLSEVPFLLFFSGAVLFFYLGLHRKATYLYASWICFALALLTRYTALLFGPLVIIFLILAWLSPVKAGREHILNRHFFISPFAGIVLLLPWLLRQQFTFGNALVGFQIASGQLSAYLPGTTMPWWFYPACLPEMLSWPILLLTIPGLLCIYREKSGLGLHAVVTILFFLLWFSAFRYKEPRLITGMLPLMSIPAALGLREAQHRLTFLFRQPQTRRALFTVLAGAILLFTLILNYRATIPTIKTTVALGYPVFTQAMERLQAVSTPSDLVMGPNTPQICWYANRNSIDFPEREKFKEDLKKVSWVVITNFERGQKPYANDLLKTIRQKDLDDHNVFVFRDSRFFTVLIKSEILRHRI